MQRSYRIRQIKQGDLHPSLGVGGMDALRSGDKQ